jgi:hypothetical protein
MCIYGNISLNCSYNEKMFFQNYIENQNTDFVVNKFSFENRAYVQNQR